MKKIFPFLTILFALLISGCSSAVEETTVVNMSDVSINKSSMETVNNSNPANANSAPVSTFGERPQDSEKALSDGSTLYTTFDSYGNKIETRKFSNDPVIASLMIITGTDGTKRLEAYGQTGEKRPLPQNLTDRAYEISSVEIAASTGLKSRPTIETQISTMPASQSSSSTYPQSGQAPPPQIYAPTTKEISRQPQPSAPVAEQPAENKSEVKPVETQPETKPTEQPKKDNLPETKN